MKNFLTKSALVFALISATALTAVVAQSAANNLQPGTMVIGWLSTSNGIGANAPTVAGASCGTPVLTPGSTDFAGEFQAKGTSTCKLTFGKAKTVKPFCLVVDNTTASTYTYDTTGITMGTTVSNDLISYNCVNTSNN